MGSPVKLPIETIWVQSHRPVSVLSLVAPELPVVKVPLAPKVALDQVPENFLFASIVPVKVAPVEALPEEARLAAPPEVIEPLAEKLPEPEVVAVALIFPPASITALKVPVSSPLMVPV